MFKTWGNQNGYVALPIKGTSSDTKGPKNHAGTWTEKMFKWPEEKLKVQEWIQKNYKDGMNQYWCPSVFTAPMRRKDKIDTFNCLYADLDEVDPHKLKIKPTLAWESSPGRYAAVWQLKEPMTPVAGELINKRMSYAIGADKGGWDLTQVLRIPGSKNYKYEGNPKGAKLWRNELEYSPNYFDVNLPPLEELIPAKSNNELFESDPAKLMDYVSPYIDIIDAKTMKLIMTSEADVLLADRSARLWELECRLATLQLPRESILRIVACSNWNKYRTRADEAVRLTTEIDKAIDHVGTPDVEVKRDHKLISYSQLLGAKDVQPGWMIENIWQKASHGIIAGEPKTYKSVIATDIGISVASGTPFLGQFQVNKQGPVIYVQEENAEWVVKDRVQKIATSKGLMDGYARMNGKTLSFKPPQDIPYYVLNKEGIDLTEKEDRSYIMDLAQDIKPVLFIFDPLYLMLGGADENSSKDLRPILKWLLQAGNEFKASIMVIHHWNKHGKSSRGGQRLLGSTLLHGWVESAMYASIVDEQKHIIKLDREFRSFEKPKDIEVQFQMSDPGEYLYEARIRDMVRQDADAVVDLIKMAGQVSENEIKESLSLSKKQLQERLTKLSQAGKITRRGELWITT